MGPRCCKFRHVPGGTNGRLCCQVASKTAQGTIYCNLPIYSTPILCSSASFRRLPCVPADCLRRGYNWCTRPRWRWPIQTRLLCTDMLRAAQRPTGRGLTQGAELVAGLARQNSKARHVAQCAWHQEGDGHHAQHHHRRLVEHVRCRQESNKG